MLYMVIDNRNYSYLCIIAAADPIENKKDHTESVKILYSLDSCKTGQTKKMEV